MWISRAQGSAARPEHLLCVALAQTTVDSERVQASVKAVSEGQSQYILWQAVVVPLLLLNWFVHAHQTEPFQFMTVPLLDLAVPLLELALLLASVGMILGVSFVLFAGERVERWSTLQGMLHRMYEHVFIGMCPRPHAGSADSYPGNL